MGRKALDFSGFCGMICEPIHRMGHRIIEFHNLIESGGGTGPMKPDNLHDARCQFRRAHCEAHSVRMTAFPSST